MTWLGHRYSRAYSAARQRISTTSCLFQTFKDGQLDGRCSLDYAIGDCRIVQDDDHPHCLPLSTDKGKAASI